MDIDTDYLIVGAGASGLAFADSLLAESDVEVVLVDRREDRADTGRDAYPFVRLHSPSAYYGVNSMPLGHDQLIESGRNKGFYEQASAAEICAYFERVLGDRLEPTGRARFLGRHDHLGGDGNEHRIRDLRSGDVHTVRVRRRVVDATYQETSVPATHTPSFTVVAGCLVRPDQRPSGGRRVIPTFHRRRIGEDQRRRLSVAPRPRRRRRSDPLGAAPRHVVPGPGGPATARPGGSDHGGHRLGRRSGRTSQ